MSLNLNITADSVYGIVASISSTVLAEITINATGTNIALGQLITNAQPYTSYNANWNNQGGFAGQFIPGSTYAVYAADNLGNTVSGPITLPSPTLTIGFTTGTAYASISLAAMNSILGTSYGTLSRSWDAVNQTNIYTLGTSTALSQNIRNSAFLGNNPGYLKYIKDYGTVATIGNSAFAGASQMTSIVFPWTTQIGSNVFENGVAISNINFASLNSVGTAAFANLDATISTIVMRGTTSTQSLFGSVPTARYIPTYVINTDQFPSLTMLADRNVATTGTSILVNSSATNIMDGFVVTASIYSSLLKGFYNTTTFSKISSGITGGTLTVPDSLPNTDTIYIVYDYSRSAFPLYNVNFDDRSHLYLNAPISQAIQIIPKVFAYATPVTADTNYTVNEGSSSQPVPINVTGYYNTSTVSTLASTSTPHPGTLTVGGNGYTIYYQPDPIFNGQDSFTFSVIGRNGVTSNVSTVYITVNPKTVVISTTSDYTPKSNSGNRFKETFTATGGISPYIFSIGGTPPFGLTLSSSTVASAVLTGTTTSTVGTYNFYIQANDSSYPSISATRNFTLQVFPAAPVANPTPLTIFENSPATLVPLNFTGNPASVSTVTNAQYGTTIVSGTTITYQPYQGFSGVDTFTFRGTNISGVGNISTATITVTPSPILFSLPTGSFVPPPSPIVKQYYQSPTITASGGYGTYQFSATGLPPGISLLYNQVSTLNLASLSSGTSYSTATNVATSAVSGSGSRLTVDITTNLAGNIRTVTVNQAGRNYGIGDVVSIVQGAHTNATISVASLRLGFTFSGTPTNTGLYNPIITVHDSGTPNLYSTTTYALNVASGPTVIGSANYDGMQQATSGIAQVLYNLYNTTPYSTPVTSGQLIKATDWTNLYDDMERCYIHQHGPGNVDDRTAFIKGKLVEAASTASLMPKIASLINNYTSVAPGQLTTYAVSLTTATTTSTIGGYSFSWPDDASAQAFFNLGGYIESDFDNSVFTLTNYSKTIFTVVTGTITTPSVGAGTQQVFIEGNGSNINFIVDIVSNDQVSLVSTTNSIRYHASNADTGGVAATLPYVQLITSTLGPLFSPPSLLQVYGNDVTTSTIFIANQGVLPVNIISVVPVHDTNYATEPLTLNVISYPWGGTLGAFGQSSAKGPLVFSWQNNNENGGRGFYVNSVAITYTQGLQSQTVIIPTPVQTHFGIKAIPGVPIIATATTDYYIPYTFKGYGGVLDTDYGITPRVATYATGFSISSYGPTYYVPDAPPITVKLSTNYVPNRTTSTVAYFSGRDTYNEYVTTSTPIRLTVNSKDQHINSWISAQNANTGVIGMSYDIINGQRCLTIGFGMGGGLSNQLVVDANGSGYSTYSGDGYHKAIKQLQGKYLGIPANYNRYSGTATNQITPFLTDFGVWNPKAFVSDNNTSFSQTYKFLVRNSYSYRWQADCTAPGTWQITGNNNGISYNSGVQNINPGGNPYGSTSGGTLGPLQAGVYSITLNCPNMTASKYAIGFRIYDSNLPALNPTPHIYSEGSTVWSTLDTILPTWCDLSRIYLPMDGVPRTYQPTEYIISTGLAAGQPYGSYFANSSMFTINHDGLGGLSVNINAVDHVTGQAVVDQTLINVAFLFYYQSNYESSAGFNARYNQLPGGTNEYTPYFKGFDSAGNVITTTVATPQALPAGQTSDSNILFAATIILETYALYKSIQAGKTINETLTLSGQILGEEAGSTIYGGVTGDNNIALLGEQLGSLPYAYIDAASLLITLSGTNDPTLKALNDAYMAISAVGVAATLLSQVGIGVVATTEGVSFFAIGIEVLFGTGFFCFTDDTEVSMADGTTKRISDVVVGDYVFNHDKSQTNKVTFIVDSKYTGKIYSPSKDIKAFGSWEHPLIIDGQLSSYDTDYTDKNYSWLGKSEQLTPANISEVENASMYNLLVDGDGTYRVNDIGTTSVIGDGGAVIKMHNRGLLSRERALSTIKYYHDKGGLSLKLWYLGNNLFGKQL
jgi:hypothetical protein